MGGNPWLYPQAATNMQDNPPPFGRPDWQPPKSIPLWAASPREAMTGADDAALATSLLNRYQTQNPFPKLKEEMGLGPVWLNYSESPDVRSMTNEPLMGVWRPDERKIAVKEGLPPAQKMATFAHELGHAADDLPGLTKSEPSVSDFYTPMDRNNPAQHHKYFENFEPQMAQSIETQHALEQGWPVHPELPKTYPWLKSVKPYSSNKLSNPWVK